MKLRLAITMILILSTTVFLFPESSEDKGLRIARENEQINNGYKGEHQVTEMVLVNAQGDRTVRKMTSRTIETARDGDKSIITFLWPADVKGTRMLTHSHKRRDDDQWLYLPSLKRIKRISSRNKSGAFMGSEFAYEDLGSQEIEKYHYRWIEDKTLGERDCWVIEQIPVSKKSGYSRQISYVDKVYRGPVRMEYFDRKGELLKVAVFSEYKKISKWWRFHKIEMKNVQTRKRSLIEWKERKLDGSMADEDFESDALTED